MAPGVQRGCRAFDFDVRREQGHTTEMAGVTPSNMSWWEDALAGFAKGAAIYLRRRYPSIHQLHDDLVGDVLVEMIELLKGRYAAKFPEEATPEALRRFNGLAYTLLDRRVADHFRSRFLRPTEPIDDVPEEHLPSTDGRDVDRRIDTHRAVIVLLALIEEMGPQDRRLLMQTEAMEAKAPRSDVDRQRLRRLRQFLIQKLLARLGEDALDTIRRIDS